MGQSCGHDADWHIERTELFLREVNFERACGLIGFDDDRFGSDTMNVVGNMLLCGDGKVHALAAADLNSDSGRAAGDRKDRFRLNPNLQLARIDKNDQLVVLLVRGITDFVVTAVGFFDNSRSH